MTVRPKALFGFFLCVWGGGCLSLCAATAQNHSKTTTTKNDQKTSETYLVQRGLHKRAARVGDHAVQLPVADRVALRDEPADLAVQRVLLKEVVHLQALGALLAVGRRVGVDDAVWCFGDVWVLGEGL